MALVLMRLYGYMSRFAFLAKGIKKIWILTCYRLESGEKSHPVVRHELWTRARSILKIQELRCKNWLMVKFMCDL